ncbi:CpsD/CapB family tyrosine-protein kinase [Brevibacillus daliensis]|uniref:CpsD/CapB family tyrosine-protein kinase n=1 Tax=Brevibacillus daliensis TaxID=2892995 RepID=UPI001E64E882|nr:CpsD/CapB family tyrosine-protein kinase [Brevibacillus daliensis]
MRSKAITKRAICLYEPNSSVAEAYRILRTNIQFTSVMKQIKTLIVTSSGPEEGKTTTIVNLAIVLAETGKRIILIDGDLRKPMIHRVFNLQNDKGLTNFLTGKEPYNQVIQTVHSCGLDVITAGPTPPNPTDFIASPDLEALIKQLRLTYDMVLIDSPPVLPVTDSQLLAGYSDGVLLVVRAGKATKEHIKKTKKMMEIVGAHVIGTVLNSKKVGKKGMDAYYSYTD